MCKRIDCPTGPARLRAGSRSRTRNIRRCCGLKKLLNWKGRVVATVRTKLKAAELEAAIAKRLAERPECAGIIQVYVKATGREPPEDTWMHTLVSRRPNSPRLQEETTVMHAVLNEMRKEFDLLPDE